MALLNILCSICSPPHKVLNAKFHEQEAEIIADAGVKGAVTIATNMAGRGTDIKLGEGVAEPFSMALLNILCSICSPSSIPNDLKTPIIFSETNKRIKSSSSDK